MATNKPKAEPKPKHHKLGHAEEQREAPAPRLLSPKWDDRSTFRVPEVAEILGIAPWSAWQAVKVGQLAVIKIGGRTIVPRHVVERLLTAV
jgi:hypothetical protein